MFKRPNSSAAFVNYLSFLAGLVILIVGGEGLVRGASGIARHFRLSPLLIGLTIVGFGILGTTALVTPIPAEPRFTQVDMFWMAAATAS